MKDMLYALLTLVSFILALASYFFYTNSSDNKLWLGALIVFALIGLGLAGVFLSGRVNKKEDIHITE